VTPTGVVVLAGCVTLLLTVASAAGPFDGRWAADPQACETGNAGTGLLVVETLSLRWREATCAVRSSYRVGDALHMAARCWVDGATASLPITLQLRGERLMLNWAGAPAQELRRCP
jgi:hypothetical protein